MTKTTLTKHHPHLLSKSHLTLCFNPTTYPSPHIVAMAQCGCVGGASECTNERLMTQLQQPLLQDSPKLTNVPSLLHQNRVLWQRFERTIVHGLEGLLINIFTDYPDIFEDATVIISQEQKDDPAMYYYPQGPS